MAKGTNCIL